MNFSCILVAAGSGSRAGGDKQWRSVAAKPVIRWSVEAMLAAGAAPLVIVVAPDSHARLQAALEGLSGWRAVSGADTRAGSVQNGLAALKDQPGQMPVLIHDAARPFLTKAVIDRLLAALETADGALPALAVADSLRHGEGDLVSGMVERDNLWRAQTPQAFRLDTIVRAYRDWPELEIPTDEVAVVQRAGGRVRIVEGDARLMKLTYPEDFAMAEALAPSLAPTKMRIGQGYDVHRWGPGNSVWLCGLEIPHDQTLIGHSDADAGLHALTDAILGAIADGDIGDHFPPSDPKWKGASSDLFLIHAAEKVWAKGGQIVNVDLTLICERPKVKPHREAMRQKVAELLKLPLDAVSVKATTTEGLGFTGRGEGLAAQAVVLVALP